MFVLMTGLGSAALLLIVVLFTRQQRVLVSELANRVHELSQVAGNLREAQDQLVRGERLAAIGQLTGTVSHELRNPLGVIQNSLFSLSERVSNKGLGVERILQRMQRNISW